MEFSGSSGFIPPGQDCIWIIGTVPSGTVQVPIPFPGILLIHHCRGEPVLQLILSVDLRGNLSQRQKLESNKMNYLFHFSSKEDSVFL